MVRLATKCYVAGDARERALRSLRDQLADEFGGLAVETEVAVGDGGFVDVSLDGADAAAARNRLAEQWGAVPGEFEAGTEYVGTLEAWDEEGFVLDAGRELRVPADELGLGPGSPAQVRERFGLVQHLPMRLVYRGGGDPETPADERPHRLADPERDRLYGWSRGSGRVNVNSATRSEVRATVNRAGHARDIVTVERLGLLEQSVVCRPGTDPPGLLAAIGEYLPAELRCVVP